MADFSIDSNPHGGPITADVTCELTGLANMRPTGGCDGVDIDVDIGCGCRCGCAAAERRRR